MKYAQHLRELLRLNLGGVRDPEHVRGMTGGGAGGCEAAGAGGGGGGAGEIQCRRRGEEEGLSRSKPPG